MIRLFKKRKKNQIDDLDFLSFVSHELKTPLSTLKLSVDMLKKTPLTEEKRLIEIMDQEVDWMIQFVSDTLDIRRADNKVILNSDWHKWNSWIQTIRKRIEEKTKLHGRKLEIHFSDKEIPVYMDPLYIRQVLLNLIFNAIEYSFENSSIEVSWKQTEKGELNVQVMDQGPGIKPEHMEKIFEPFNREREKTNSAIKGSGLGLFIVKKIVQAHGGEVYTHNRPDGKGAVFVFTLPQTRAIFE